MRPLSPALFLSLVLSAPAVAGEFAARDMGSTWRGADCMQAARLALREFADRFGGENVAEADWAVSAEALGPGGQDAIITCTFGNGGRTRGTLVVHSAHADVRRIQVADGIARLWRLHAARLGDE